MHLIDARDAASPGPTFAVVIPVGPGECEAARLQDLLASLHRYEPAPAWLIVVDDGPPSRRLDESPVMRRFRRATSLPNPRCPNGLGAHGGVAVGVLTALDWLHRQGTYDFVLKLDTDSLVIAPFAVDISRRVRATPQAGILGALGRTCNRESPDYGRGLDEVSPIVRTLAQWRLVTGAAGRADPDDARGGDLPSDATARQRFSSLCPRIEAAECRGYRARRYCQGGGYAISGAMLHAGGVLGYWEDVLGWSHLPFGEDVILGMYAYAAGLEVVDASWRGEPFGVHFRGLAYAPDELLARGHAIVHSVRNDRTLPEESIRAFFAARRGERERPATT